MEDFPGSERWRALLVEAFFTSSKTTTLQSSKPIDLFTLNDNCRIGYCDPHARSLTSFYKPSDFDEQFWHLIDQLHKELTFNFDKQSDHLIDQRDQLLRLYRELEFNSEEISTELEEISKELEEISKERKERIEVSLNEFQKCTAHEKSEFFFNRFQKTEERRRFR